MFLINDNTLVTLDVVERFFCCDIDACLGQCCIDGDAGAPLTAQEEQEIKQILPEIWDDLLPRAQQEIEQNGISYLDPEGELVTQILDNSNCVFSCYAPGGKCICAIEKAYREGRISFLKPISCALYPLRLKTLNNGSVAVNYHRWKICKSAEVLGRSKGIRVYEFLKEPLIRRFGQQWYDELVANCELYIKQYLS
ncbi:MAG: DUF3109 family protein [Muribaculaceae bacterium]|nr:DUF3109 family protein [Muribaculaceae bacterium]MBQ3910295.1 DUF3109 family protein [Muribaculaceae bacterium]